MRIPTLCLLFVIALFSTDGRASSDIGFVINKGAFSLTVRFPFTWLGESKKSVVSELTEANGLLFDCINWTYSNGKELEKTSKNIVFYVDSVNQTFHVDIDGKAYKEVLKWGEARSANTLLSFLAGLLEKPVRVKPNSEIPLYAIISKEYIDDPSGSTDIFFGSIPGYMHSRSEQAYVALLWSEPNKERWKAKIESGQVKLLHKKFDRKMLGELLGRIE